LGEKKKKKKKKKKYIYIYKNINIYKITTYEKDYFARHAKVINRRLIQIDPESPEFLIQHYIGALGVRRKKNHRFSWIIASVAAFFPNFTSKKHQKIPKTP
jgi:hypothetical protein